MSATAFKNAVRRREHYERHQPAARAHLGLLEKHKDYTQRARAFHAKEARIAELKKKAANRNPDEFYYKMLSTSTKVSGTGRARRPTPRDGVPVAH
jgi:U3 small nucleolar RNA-associated protein 11